MAYPRFRRARAHKFSARTAGTVTINSLYSSAYQDIDNALDMTLEAQAGDVLEYGINGYWANEAVDGYLDVATIVSATPVNYFGGGVGSGGIVGWTGLNGAITTVAGSYWKTVVSGDISGGLVTLRLRGATFTATNKTLRATTTQPLQVWVKNLGPVDPH